MATISPGLRFFQTATLRSHIPLMKFPNRISLDKRFPLLEKLKNMIVEKSSKASGITTKQNGIIVETVEELPERYKRHSIPSEEIDYIERGGPD